MSVTITRMAPWQGASTCTGSVTPGSRALMAYWLEQYEPISRSLGIYNCRTVRGGSTTSLHGEGRAGDQGNPVTDEGIAVQYEFLRRLAPHCERLGIQLIIFDRTIWSKRRVETNGNTRGERYNGVHPHRDHSHIELTWNAARNLTLATLRAVVGDFRGDDSDNGRSESASPSPGPAPSSPSPDTSVPGRLTRRGQKSLSVGIDQGLLLAHGHGPAGLVTRSGIPDRDFGPSTERLIRAFQERQGLAVDGIVGPATRGRLVAPWPTTVRRGDDGAAVGRLQGLLMAWGYGAAGLVASPGSSGRQGRPDRDFGPATERIVRAFQRDRRIGVDGIAGPQTYAALLRR